MKLVPFGVSRAAGSLSLKGKAASPHILFGVGVVGMVTSTVLACRATLRLQPTLEQIENDLHAARQKAISESEMVAAYARALGKLARLYGPAVIVGGASIAALSGSHVQLTKRNTALMAAYSALHTAFEEYKERVGKEVGDKKEFDLRHDVIEGKGGKASIGPGGRSIYSVIFDESNPNWKRDAELNRMFIECYQTYANHRLRARGHVFLNEVYEALGFEHTSPGSFVGWVWNSDEGDNYISFGVHAPGNERFVNGDERSVILDFNVDGPIWDKI